MTPPHNTLWVKICGIRDVETAEIAVDAGANALGLNFYAPSPRSITAERAAEIVESLPLQVTPIGLFVNHTVTQIEQIMETAGLETLQLHGDETPDFLADITENHPLWNIIWARRVNENDIADVDDDLRECDSLGVKLFACLLDPKVDGAYGGTGETLSWKLVARHYDQTTNPPLILAGGITPDNVAEAVSSVHPWGIDVASGVETEKGVKNADLIHEFIDIARSEIQTPSNGPKP
ncbi:MAG: phosphoribosylanthranilate isomerase [Planctomycetaceae bacterium]|jgi:phosphoribosylanthranilate isomerase|nr:phosphoribosylanthranilate isomerase [Planctomycetaceae bacterium]MDC0274522.1 phosphoribosylanthranilate isomerase [Planctomycetaceae bacterium]MDG2391716.1 phosphoribosylanthranilate isomerase [Planctomycetaceae bacterium]